MPSCCALLGGLAIGARISLLWQQRRTRNASECLYLLYASNLSVGYFFLVIVIEMYRKGQLLDTLPTFIMS